MSLVRRTVQSIGWASGTSIARAFVLFGRSALLARMLPVDAFGMFAGAMALRTLTQAFAGFGLQGAFLNRSEESQDEDAAAAVHFTLQLILSTIWVVIMSAVGYVIYDGLSRTVFLVLLLLAGITSLTTTPRLILRRRVVYRRLSLVNITTDIATTAAALLVAFWYPTVWALVATEAAIAVVNVVMFYLWKPVWRPRFSLARQRVRYFLHYGSQVLAGNWLRQLLDQIDNFWTQWWLGDYALGLYSRAFSFASYPALIVGLPIHSVGVSAFAELKGQRQRLSRMFFHICALLIRSGFLFAGIMSLIAPEFIRIVLGVKWIAFLDAFRLMMIYTLLDPLKGMLGEMFVAVGMPKVTVRARLVQLVVFIIALFALGPRWNIVGVAVAADIMLTVGVVIMLWEARKVVDFSAVRLFAAPTFALVVALLLGRLAVTIPGVLGSDWRTAAVKIAVFCPVYCGLLYVMERRMLHQLLAVVRGADSDR